MNEQNAKELEFAAFVGWDWADQQHELRLQVAGSAEVERQVIKQDPTALREWVEQLRKRFAGAKVAIAIEQARGAVVYALMAYDFLVIYPINPKCLASYREAFRPSNAKDDPFDAELALDLLTKHRDQLRSWQPDDELTRTLRLHVEHRREMVNERGRLTNRVKSVLKCYFPKVCAGLEIWAVDRPAISCRPGRPWRRSQRQVRVLCVSSIQSMGAGIRRLTSDSKRFVRQCP